MGEGSLRDSITLLDQSISYTNGDLKASLVASMLGLLDPAKIDEILNLVVKQDRDAIIDLIEELENHDVETTIDQLIANLKEKFLNRDPKFSILMYERFFRILSEAKGMLNMGSDNSFTMAMTLFLLMEALNLKSIDEVIRAETTKKTETFSEKTEPNLEQKIEPKVAQPKKELSVYDKYLDNLYDRDYDLGECFKESVEYVEFKDNTLFVISHAEGKNREILRKSSRAIMDVLRNTINRETKIKISQPQKSAKEEPAKEEKQEIKQQEEPAKQESFQNRVEELEAKVSLKKEAPQETLQSENKFLNLTNPSNLANLEADKYTSLEEKRKQMFEELRGMATAKESEEERSFKELKRLFGEPKVIDENPQ